MADEIYLENKAAAAAANLIGFNRVMVQSFATPGDDGGAHYIRVGSQPSHTGKFQNTGDSSWWEIDETVVNPLMFGANRGGGTVPPIPANNVTAFNNAISYLNIHGLTKLYIRGGTYVVDSTIVVDAIGIELIGDSGLGGRSILQSTSTSGPVIRVKARSCQVSELFIDAIGARLTSTTADAHGIFIGPDNISIQDSMSRVKIERVSIREQPDCGIYAIGGLLASKFDTLEINNCGGHGILVDDGSAAGYTTYKTITPGLFDIIRVKSDSNGGHGIAVGSPTMSNFPYRINVIQADVGKNAASATVRFTHHQCYFYGQTFVFDNSAFEDGAPNSPRSGGIYFRDSNRGDLRCVRFLNTTSSVELAGNSFGITVANPAIIATPQQDPAIIVPAGTNAVIWSSIQSGVKTLVKNNTTDCTYTYNGREFTGLAAYDWRDFQINGALYLGDAEYTDPNVFRKVTSGTLMVVSDLVSIITSTGAAANLDKIFTPSGTTVVPALPTLLPSPTATANAKSGTKVTLVNQNAYTITCVHTAAATAGTMKNKSGANVALGTNQSITYVSNGTVWIEV